MNYHTEVVAHLNDMRDKTSAQGISDTYMNECMY